MTSETAETVDHLAQAFAALITTGLTVYAFWKISLSEEDREHVRSRARAFLARWNAVLARRQEQAGLTYEVFLVLTALEDYNAGHDLRERLAVA